jgi:hypothetical protein
MNDIILNCLVISFSISISNLVAQYIIERYIRKTTYVTLSEHHLTLKQLEEKIDSIGNRQFLKVS